MAHDRHLTSCLYQLADDPGLRQRISRLGQRAGGNARPYRYVNTHQYTRRAQQYPNPNCYTDTHWTHRYIDPYKYTNGPTFTPTRTNTPSGPSALRVQYRAADTNAADNQIKPHFNILNSAGSSVPLSELKIRYWYTREGTTGQNFFCDYAVVNCSNITGAFVQVSPARTGADFYLEVGFSAAAGSIAAGGQSGEIQARFAKTDWSNFNETGDYSFDPTKTSFADWDHVTLYRNGTLVWGTEPGGGGPTNTPTRTNTPWRSDQHIHPDTLPHQHSCWIDLHAHSYKHAKWTDKHSHSHADQPARHPPG